jgi:hypothetical protein
MGAYENEQVRLRQLLVKAGVRRRFGTPKHAGDRPVDEWPGWIHMATGRWMGLTVRDAYRSAGIQLREKET